MTTDPTAGTIHSGESFSLGPAFGFIVRALGWIALLFGMLRLPWIQEHLMVPFASIQQSVGCTLLGAPRNAVIVDQSCTGSDAIALAVGAILAFPATWRRRFLGALTGLFLITAVNTVRIGTLAMIAKERELFLFLHLTAWPAAIIVIAATYVFAWMQWANRGVEESLGVALGRVWARNRLLLRFVALTLLCVGLYYAASKWFLESDWLLRVAHWATAIGGAVMGLLGVESAITGNYISTAYGRWVVTQECIATPLVAVYLAAVFSISLSPLRRVAAVLAAAPLFILLGSARLLVLALPKAAVGSHEIAIHAFYQVLAGVVIVAFVASRRGHSRPYLAVAVGTVAGLIAGWLTAPSIDSAVAELAPQVAPSVVDPQGALSLLPGYQFGLWFALVYSLRARGRAKPLAVGATILIAFQLAFVGVLVPLLARAGIGLPVIVIRMIAVGVPLTLMVWLLRHELFDQASEERLYRRFWADVGRNFPELDGAESTAMYQEDEQRLFEDHLSPLEGRRVLKTDLCDEAKNSRILHWVASQGAHAYGLDISPPIARRAANYFQRHGMMLRGVISDVRAIPFRDGAFDTVYSMGTVEHFDETERAIGEIYRVLKPGGEAVIGVPNRFDPFLRPLLVSALDRLSLYGYGFEKSYSRASLRRMVKRIGFRVEAETGILFIPGWVRMLDLALHAWARSFTILTKPLVRVFRSLSRRFPALRRHGYLLAIVVRRPG